MGNPSYPDIDTLKEIDRENVGKSRPSQLVVIKRKAIPRNGGHLMRNKRSGNVILIKRSRVSPLEGNNRRRARSGIKSRVRTLKKLVPNTESMELDVLFRETADYIKSLEMRVKVMQTMVQVLTGSN